MSNFNDTQNAMMEDLDSLEEMTFDEAELSEADEKQKEYDVADHIHNIEEMLPEFDDYFKQNRHRILETLLDKNAVDDAEQETKYAQLNNHSNIKFNNDDDVIEAMFHYVSLDLLSKRMKVMQDYYREHIIKIHKECSDSKKFSTPIMDVQESTSRNKPTLQTKPSQVQTELESKMHKDSFFGSLPELNWNKMTKGGYEKVFEMMMVSDSDAVKKLYKKLEEDGIVKMTGGSTSYKITPRIDN